MIKLARIQKLQKKIQQENLDAFLVTFIPDLVYLTELSMEGYWIVVSKDNWWILTNRLLDGAFRDMGAGDANLKIKMNFKGELEALISQNRWSALAFDGEVATYGLGKYLEEKGFKDYPKFMASLRIYKDKEEIQKLRKSCQITAQSLAFVARKLKPGVPETTIAYMIENFMRLKGAEKTSFDLIVGSGPNSAVPHHRTGSRKLKEGDAVVIDIGCIYENYCSDMTRTLYVGKKKSELFKKIHGIVQESQHKGIKKLRAGLRGGDIDGACREVIEKAGFADAFTHGTGHGVGIEIHEPPWVRAKSDNPLEAGMIVTVEPGIYLDGKLGVRIEDTLLVTKNGSEILTRV